MVSDNPVQTGAPPDAPSLGIIRAAAAAHRSLDARRSAPAYADLVTVVSPHLATPSAPHYTGSLPARLVCRIVARLTVEMAHMVTERVAVRRDRRRLAAHIRQISMYICHVALRIPHADVAAAFGRDRSTVGHACHFVEDRRDDEAFDAFVSAIERVVTAVFRPCDIAPLGGDDE